jgi:crotonobetainyl-CoA:carnitine CoA-transferase CaiB-like acyl-CoA transferase
MRAGIAVADTSAGLYCAMGIMTALLEREVSGEGQWVQVSLLESMIAMLDFQAARWLMAKEIPQQAGNDHPTSIPTGVYPTADGYINIAAGEQIMWKRLCNVLEAPDLYAKAEFATGEARSLNRAAVNDAIAAITRQRTSEHWLAAFEKGNVAAGPINKMNEVFADPQVRHLRVAQPLTHRKRGPTEVVGQPFRMDRTPSEIRTAAPERGEDTDMVLAEIGYAKSDIQALRKDGVV